jgi:hypothetical protein
MKELDEEQAKSVQNAMKISKRQGEAACKDCKTYSGQAAGKASNKEVKAADAIEDSKVKEAAAKEAVDKSNSAESA